MVSRSLYKIAFLSALLFCSSIAQESPENKKGALSQDSLSVRINDDDSTKILIEKKSIKDDILDLVYGAIFRDTTNNSYDHNGDLIASEEQFRVYEAKRIAHIYLKKIPVFGGAIDDSLVLEIADIEKFGNTLHSNTNDWVIFENLLFREGDEVRPFQFADNERLLRQLPFIRDARILIIPRKEDDQVDVLILTRDVFSIGASLNVRTQNDIALSVYDRNLFGNGWEFRNTFRHRPNRDPSFGFEGVFDVRNIMGTFISGTASYSTSYELEQGRLVFSKGYLTQEMKWAGGLDLVHTSFKDEKYGYRTLLYRSNSYDLWTGRSFIIGHIENQNDIKIGLRYFQKDYDNRPSVQADSNFNYHKQKLYLGNILFNRLKYLTSNMILGFGRTEDIPRGYALEFTAGIGDEEFKDRLYSGMQFWAAYWFKRFGYLAFTVQASSYIYHEKAEDGLTGIRFVYFTTLMDLGRYNFRHFLYADYLTGFNRSNNQLIEIEDDGGIRGLSHDGLFGKERFVLRLESRTFTPWNLIGFRFSLLSFADFGLIGDGHDLLNGNNFSSALGVGCQIRNEGLVLQTISVRFAYYPRVPDGVSHFGINISLSEPLLFSQIRLGKPRVFPFE